MSIRMALCWGLALRKVASGFVLLACGPVMRSKSFSLQPELGLDPRDLESLNAEIKQLEAQKKLVEKRDGEVPKALAVLQRYAKVLTPA